MKVYRILLILLTLRVLCALAKENVVKRHFAASVADMEILLNMEKKLIKSLKNYVDELNSKVKTIKNSIKSMETDTNELWKIVQSPLENTLNNFSLTQRLYNDWSQWLHYVNEPIGKDFVNAINETLKRSPTLDDVNEAAEGLQRIQVAYDLNIDDMAKGKLYKYDYGTKLTALDLHAMGLMLYRAGSHQNAINWLEASLKTKFNETIYLEVFRTGIQRFYFDYKTIALKTSATSKSLNDIQSVSRSSYQNFEINTPEDPLIHSFNFRAATLEHQRYLKTVFKIYKRTCRGKRRNSKSVLKKNFCFYKNNAPFLKIAPIKAEVQNMNPLIILFIDVISEKEIRTLKTKSKFRMERAKLINETISTALVAKTFTIPLKNSKFDLMKWKNRLETIINGKFSSLMVPEVVNYGIGGHYGVHFDTEPSSEYFTLGNRSISSIVFLSDVEQGGATIFPILDVSVFPRKGAALVWFNMFDDRMGDYRTMHASCPVIKGSKWILNQWICKNNFQIKPDMGIDNEEINLRKEKYF